jgi:hypothetical protein
MKKKIFDPFDYVETLSEPEVLMAVCRIGPVAAAELLKRNFKNRNLKTNTIDAYARDMRNRAWLLTHQAIAFDTEGNLIDGQHRLQAIVASKATVLMLVITGIPAVTEKQQTMDAVDRGVNRSIADQLSIQHGIINAGRIVQIANAIAASCFGARRVRKGSTDCVLKVVSLFSKEIKWLVDGEIPTTCGLRSAQVLGNIVIGRAVWPDKTSDFWHRLRTGENLTATNPCLHLRNWLMSGNAVDRSEIRNGTLGALHSFVHGRQINNWGGANLRPGEGVAEVTAAIADRAKVICEIYGSEFDELGKYKSQGTGPRGEGIYPFSPEVVAACATLGEIFTSTDLRARFDQQNAPGTLLSNWAKRDWIEAAGPGTFRKTEKFGKI